MRIWLMSILLASSAALAAKPSVVLQGPAPVTKWVSKELSKRYTPKVLSRGVGAMPTAKEVRAVTAPTSAVALVICQASGQFITLQVLNGADGTPLDTVSIKASAKKLPKVMPKPSLAALMFAVGSGKAPGKEAPEPEPVAEKTEPEPVKETPVEVAPAKVESKKEVAARKKKEKETEKEEPKPVEVVETRPEGPPAKRTAHPALRVGIGPGGFNRSFTWAGNPSPSLATANQPFSGSIAVDAAWYPGAHFTSNILAHLGLFASGDFGVGMVSRVGESRFAHSASRLRFAGLFRLPLGDRFSLAAHVGYSRHELTTSDVAVNDGSARPNIPNVLFNGFRTGPLFRWRMFSTVELEGVAGFMPVVVGKGELGSERYFPQATAMAIDASGAISVGLAENLRLRGSVEWLRYFVTLNPTETSTFFAQSAGDQYITTTVSIVWSM